MDSPPLHRIEIGSRFSDPRAEELLGRLARDGCAPGLAGLTCADVVTFAARLRPDELARLAAMLAHPVSRPVRVDAALFEDGFDWALEVGFLPGVTDNVARTVQRMAADELGRALDEDESVHSSRLYLLRGSLRPEELDALTLVLANPLVERVHLKSAELYARDGGMDPVAPRVSLVPHPQADAVDLEVDEAELARIGRGGIAEPGERDEPARRRGPLALDLASMLAIREHFRALGRNPTDVELESVAQNWSEHCRHLLFNSPVDEDVPEGLFRRYIRGATEAIRARRGAADPCVSVFVDNAGAIAFDDEWLVTDKVETHNSPSALDPYGGALTGILGVNRDALGFGLGAKPILNRYGFCLPHPDDGRQLFRSADRSGALLPPRLLAEGIFKGVEVGGNCCGIPTPQGFLCFHEGYRAKPLVFVGTLGLIPRREGGRELHRKRARPGDRIVMAGGRVGLDGIHGATFSSEALASGSPATAVQIGDPIGQKLLLDVLLREARGRALYSSLTDNGAGGLSCSVPEMAQEAGGCRVELERVPLKYPGMAPWQIWISESQERMTLAVPPEHVDELIELFRRRGVEATDIGAFTGDGRCVVTYRGATVMDLELKFLLDGWPVRRLQTRRAEPVAEAPDPAPPEPRDALLSMLAAPGFSSREHLALRFDHEVQGSSVLKPLTGPGRADADATVIRPLLGSWRGVAVSQGLCPTYTELDPYRMAAWAVDAAVRPLLAVGARLEDVALLDNFCWCSPQEPERLWQLKEAARACHDTAVAYGTPFISGKDSMHNDFHGHAADGSPVKLSIPPTLLISSLAVIADVRRVLSPEPKAAGDSVFLLGHTHGALGGSAWRVLRGLAGGEVPPLDTAAALRLYRAHAEAHEHGLLASSMALGAGGLALAAARAVLGSRLGLRLELGPIYAHRTCGELSEAELLYSESPARLLLTCRSSAVTALRNVLWDARVPFACIGSVSDRPELLVRGADGHTSLVATLAELQSAYRTDWRVEP
jgi:phosphoribosylformylglycinamidine synthase subunit PurSL